MRYMIDLQSRIDAAGKGNGDDITSVLRAAMDDGPTVAVARAAKYRIANLDLKSSDTLHLEEGATFSGMSWDYDDTLMIATGSLSRIKITGGLWGYGERVLDHSAGVLSECTFAGMQMGVCGEGLRIYAAVKCTFGNSDDRGHLRGLQNCGTVLRFLGKQATNENTIHVRAVGLANALHANHSVSYSNAPMVAFEDGSSTYGRNRLIWISAENCAGVAVDIAGTHEYLDIDTYCEGNKGDEDIRCVPGPGNTVHMLSVRGQFGVMATTAKRRIYAKGRVGWAVTGPYSKATIGPNHFLTVDATQSDLAVEYTRDLDHVRLIGDLATPERPYPDALVEMVDAPAPYRYRPGGSSGYVSGQTGRDWVEVNYP